MLASATSLAIATTDRLVVYGDAEKHAVFAVPKAGGPPLRIGEGNPIAIAVTAHTIAWIAAPGDVLRRVSSRGGLEALADVTPLEEQGSTGPRRFTAIAADGDDLVASEASPAGSALMRVRKDDVTRIATFEGSAHALAVDALGTYVATPSEVLLVPTGGSIGQLVTTGVELAGLVVSSMEIFTTSDAPGSGRALIHAPKSGGAAAPSMDRIRLAPIAVFREHVYFLDRDHPVLRRIPLAGGDAAVVARAPELSWVVALAVDESGVYVAADHGRTPRVLAFANP